MFGFGKPKAPQKLSGGEPIIAALLTEGLQYPVAAIQAVLAKTPLNGLQPEKFKIDGDILTFNLGDAIAAIAPMPAPYPWRDLEGPCATSWMWPKETKAATVQRAKGHVLVTLIGGSADPVNRRLALTQLTAQAAQQPGVMGIYWPEATLVHYPPIFVKMAQAIKNPKAPPLYLWVDFRVMRNPDNTTALFTTGLRHLGHMEIEIPRSSSQPQALREWTMNIICYLLEKGPVLKHGQTIGVSADEQLPIRHTTSSYGHKHMILRIGA